MLENTQLQINDLSYYPIGTQYCTETGRVRMNIVFIFSEHTEEVGQNGGDAPRHAVARFGRGASASGWQPQLHVTRGDSPESTLRNSTSLCISTAKNNLRMAHLMRSLTPTGRRSIGKIWTAVTVARIKWIRPNR